MYNFNINFTKFIILVRVEEKISHNIHRDITFVTFYHIPNLFSTLSTAFDKHNQIFSKFYQRSVMPKPIRRPRYNF